MAKENAVKVLGEQSPLGLLALAIVAGVAAVSTHTPPNKDAGYDVIGYFYCERNKHTNLGMALVEKGSSFGVLAYDGDEPSVLEKGKPIDLSYLIPIGSEEKIGAKSYSWQESGYTVTLDRSNGTLIKNYPGVKANLPGCKGFGCLESVPFTLRYNCKFGEEGKKLFWEATVKDYERKLPKF